MQHENPPSLSTMLKCAGRFCFYGYMATRIPFIKTYSTPHELVQLLKTRGMEESWLTIITVTRNSCCHHARVWNRVFSIRATMPIRMSRPWITLPTDPLKVYFDMCIIKYFLGIISPNNDMLDKMNRLFATFPEVDKAALGFPSGWENEPLWQ